MTSSVDVKLIQELNQRLQLFIDDIQASNDRSQLTKNLLHQTSLDLVQRYRLRNTYYHRALPRLLDGLSQIQAKQCHAQLMEHEYRQFVELYKYLFNVQSSLKLQQYEQQLEQVTRVLGELKANVQWSTDDIDRLKKEYVEQTNAVTLHSKNLFELQFERKQVQSDVQRLKHRILFEKELHQTIKLHVISCSSSIPSHQSKLVLNSKACLHHFFNQLPQKPLKKNEKQDRNSTLKTQITKNQQEYIAADKLQQEQRLLIRQETTLTEELQALQDSQQTQLNTFLTESENLSNEINTIQFHIQQKAIDLIPVQFELYIYRTIIEMNENMSTALQSPASRLPMKQVIDKIDRSPVTTALKPCEERSASPSKEQRQFPADKAACPTIDERKSKSSA